MPPMSIRVHMDIEFKGGSCDLIRPRCVVIAPLTYEAVSLPGTLGFDTVTTCFSP